MTIQDIEDEIIARLKAKIANVRIESFPESPDEYYLKSPGGVILVRFAGGDYDDPETIGITAQTRFLTFEFTVVMRHLRSHKDAGVYALLDAIRIGLTGFSPQGCSKMHPVKEGFIKEDKGIWQYGMTFVFRTVNVEILEDEQGALLKKIIGVDDYGGTINN